MRSIRKGGVLPGLSREQRVLVSAISVDDRFADRLGADLGPGLDWPAIIQASIRHGILPLLHTRLEAVPGEMVPPRVAAQLREAYQVNVYRNLRLAKTLVRIIDVLGANGIDVLPLKGPVLAEQAYGDVTLRQFTDLDILIRGRDLGRACRVLQGIGYELPISMSERRERCLVRSAKEVALYHGKDCLELQWCLSHESLAVRVPTEVYWDGVRSASLIGTPVKVPSAEATLLLLCLHAASHGFAVLKWIADVAHFVKATPDLDWERCRAIAQQHGAARILNLNLYLARTLCNLGLPERVLAAVEADPAVVGLSARAAARVWSGTEEAGALTHLGFSLRMRERWRDRILCCLDLAFVLKSGDVLAVDLPPALYPLYYIVRPVRLLRGAVARGL